MSSNQIQSFVDGQMDATVTWRGDSEILKMNPGVFVSEQGKSVSIQGWALFHEDHTSFVVDIWLPKDQLNLPKHEMGQGESAPAGAYLGSTKIPRSGYAKNGQIHDVEWDPASGLFKASFEFVVDTDQPDETKVSGSVVVNNLNDYLA